MLWLCIRLGWVSNVNPPTGNKDTVVWWDVMPCNSADVDILRVF
jgi:hypothetical protein